LKDYEELMKKNGFKIIDCSSYNELREVNLKRKRVTLLLDNNIWKAYSYNDTGYKVLSSNVDKDLAIDECIAKALTVMRTHKGVPVTKRTYPDSIHNNTIIWWEKGYSDDVYSRFYKAEIFLDDYPVEGVGKTLEEALEDLAVSVELSELVSKGECPLYA
jgi:hypothetical protein